MCDGNISWPAMRYWTILSQWYHTYRSWVRYIGSGGSSWIGVGVFDEGVVTCRLHRSSSTNYDHDVLRGYNRVRFPGARILNTKRTTRSAEQIYLHCSLHTRGWEKPVRSRRSHGAYQENHQIRWTAEYPFALRTHGGGRSPRIASAARSNMW